MEGDELTGLKVQWKFIRPISDISTMRCILMKCIRKTLRSAQTKQNETQHNDATMSRLAFTTDIFPLFDLKRGHGGLFRSSFLP